MLGGRRVIRNVLSIILFFFITTVVGLLEITTYEYEQGEDLDKYETYRELYSNNLVDDRLQRYRGLDLKKSF